LYKKGNITKIAVPKKKTRKNEQPRGFSGKLKKFFQDLRQEYRDHSYWLQTNLKKPTSHLGRLL